MREISTAADHEVLLDQAIQLAYTTFEDPTDAHITGVYDVLLRAAQRGESIDRLTVH